jgi:phage gp29-like protein
MSYAEWCSYWDSQISLCVFGSNLATNIQSTGSRAAAETHKETEEQIVDADADLLSGTLSQTLFKWIVDYNVPGAAPPVLRHLRAANELEHEDLRKKRSENEKAAFEQLVALYERVGAEAFAEAAEALAGVNLMPKVPGEVLRMLAPHFAGRAQTALPLDANSNVVKLRQTAFADVDHDHGIAALAAQLVETADPIFEVWQAQAKSYIEASMARGESLAECAAGLAELERELSFDALGDVIAGGSAIAELQGRNDVAIELKVKRAKNRRA